MLIYLIVVSVRPNVKVTEVLLIVVASQAVAPFAPHRHTGVFVYGCANVNTHVVGLPDPVVIVPAISDPTRLALAPHDVTVAICTPGAGALICPVVEISTIFPVFFDPVPITTAYVDVVSD